MGINKKNMKASLILVALLGVVVSKKHLGTARPIKYQEITLLETGNGVVKHKKRRIYDEDGDGVEDNVHKTWDELDAFNDPLPSEMPRRSIILITVTCQATSDSKNTKVPQELT